MGIADKFIGQLYISSHQGRAGSLPVNMPILLQSMSAAKGQ